VIPFGASTERRRSAWRFGLESRPGFLEDPMAIRGVRLLALLFALVPVAAALGACRSTFGAEDADPFGVESAEEAMSDEEEEEAWESINR
jgi:hypothetical protein